MVTLQEFVKRTGSEIVAGLIVVGEREERRVLGYLHDGTYQLNAEGHETLRNLEKGYIQPPQPSNKTEPAEKPTKTRQTKARSQKADAEVIDDIDEMDLDI